MAYNESSKQSVFNAGVALAMRLDSLQTALNAARYNPQQFNLETETFNYQIMIDSLEALRMESWSKLDKPEKETLNQMSKLIKNFLESFSPIKQLSNQTGEKRFNWNMKNYNQLMQVLKIYEEQIKQALDAHSLNSPNKDDDDEDDI